MGNVGGMIMSMSISMGRGRGMSMGRGRGMSMSMGRGMSMGMGMAMAMAMGLRRMRVLCLWNFVCIIRSKFLIKVLVSIIVMSISKYTLFIDFL